MDLVLLGMNNVLAELEEYEGDVDNIVGYKQITRNLVFDIKLGNNLCRKASYCANGNNNGKHYFLTYRNAVSWYSMVFFYSGTQ